MTLNKIRYNPAASTFLSVFGLALKRSRTQNVLLHIEYMPEAGESGILPQSKGKVKDR
jgi:hypothetical protein